MVKGVPLAMVAAGGILAWSGLFNKKITQTIQDLVSGTKPVKGPPGGTQGPGGTTGGTVAPVGTAQGINQANRTLGRAMAAARGWTGNEWNALDQLWTRESRWQNRIANESSGAYGIPQALPGSKMGPAANPPVSSAVAQIGWGLGYIAGRYRTPSAAWQHELANGWY